MDKIKVDKSMPTLLRAQDSVFSPTSLVSSPNFLSLLPQLIWAQENIKTFTPHNNHLQSSQQRKTFLAIVDCLSILSVSQ